MRIIVKDIETSQLYIFNCWENYIERMVDTVDDGQQYIKYMIFHDFYYSVKDIHGRDQIPSVTMDYLEMMNNNHRLYPACGWWNKTMIPTLSDPFDPDRFIDCTTYHAKVCKTRLNTD